MRYSKILMCMIALTACLLIGIACGQKDWLGAGNVQSSHGTSSTDQATAEMKGWLDQPVTTPGSEAAKTTTTTTSTTPSPEPTNTTKSTTTTTQTPGFEGVFAIAGLMAVACLVLGRKY